MNFNQFLTQILSGPSFTKINILGKDRQLKGITKLTSLNYRQELGYYIKIFFTDNSVLIIIPQLEQIQFSEKGDLGTIPGILDSDIGVKQIVEYGGQKYKLENANDYQYTQQLIFGNFEDVEGECRFSDYVGIDNPDFSLSLGWLVFSNQRADVCAKTITIESIQIIN